jgi:hypothetical protein
VTSVEDIIRARIEAAVRKAEATKADRARRQKARAYGLARRHAAKLARLNLTTVDNSTPAASGA